MIRHVLALGPNVGLHPDEFLTVDSALRCLPGSREANAIFELVDRVLQLALKDHSTARARGRTNRKRPTLDYIFRGPKDSPHSPHKFFLERVAKVHEQDIAAQKERHNRDNALVASAIFGTPLPVEPSVLRPSPPPREPSARDNSTIPPLELAALLDQKRAELARTG